MKEKIDKIFEDIKQLNAKDLNELEQIRIYYLGKKGVLNALFDEFKTLPPEEKKIYGKQLNDLKNQLQNFINTKKEELESKS
ncbi:MAG: phenylalanine--tRNA ligase subunit alpha, partial [Bacteroidales bacterium]|nr:phenylalanine--tRNA ligase subunit alpha [Bacteroidales bacterium]